MSAKGVLTREPNDLDREVVAYLPHPDIDYSVYDTVVGQRVYTPGWAVLTERDRIHEQRSYDRFCEFMRWLEVRGGVAKFMHSTVEEVISGADIDDVAKEDRLMYTGRDGRRHPFDPLRCRFSVVKWNLHVRLPALLHTMQMWNSLPHRHSWIIERVAIGWTYEQIALALGTQLSVFLNWLTTNVDPVTLKAAWTARTVMMLESADKLYSEAVGGDFDSECGQKAAESRAKVLSATNSHLKMQAVSRHEAYQPAKTNISITPGSISISLAAPELPAP
jgi:hypothetical protein